MWLQGDMHGWGVWLWGGVCGMWLQRMCVVVGGVHSCRGAYMVVGGHVWLWGGYEWWQGGMHGIR